MQRLQISWWFDQLNIPNRIICPQSQHPRHQENDSPKPKFEVMLITKNVATPSKKACTCGGRKAQVVTLPLWHSLCQLSVLLCLAACWHSLVEKWFWAILIRLSPSMSSQPHGEASRKTDKKRIGGGSARCRGRDSSREVILTNTAVLWQLQCSNHSHVQKHQLQH